MILKDTFNIPKIADNITIFKNNIQYFPKNNYLERTPEILDAKTKSVALSSLHISKFPR